MIQVTYNLAAAKLDSDGKIEVPFNILLDGMPFPTADWTDHLLDLIPDWISAYQSLVDGRAETELWFWRRSLYYLAVRVVGGSDCLIIATDKWEDDCGTTSLPRRELWSIISSIVDALVEVQDQGVWQTMRESIQHIRELRDQTSEVPRPAGRTPGQRRVEPEWSDLGPSQLEERMAAIIASPALAQERDASGMTLLHLAAWNGWFETVYRLCELGVDIDARGTYWWDPDMGGLTPLHMAAWVGHETTVDALLTLGADIEARDSLGDTPLHLAAFGGSRPCVEHLLRAGAAAAARNNAGQLPSDLASEEGFPEIQEILNGTKSPP